MFTRALSAIIGTALLAAPALAQNADTMTVAVRTADLDLSSADGRARLDRRVRQAAGQICGAEPRGLNLREQYLSCRGEVMTDAEVKIARMTDRSAPVLVARRAD